MRVYHISLRRYRESIQATGIRRSKSGIDGPGVYVWVGDLKTAMENASFSLMDSRNCEFEELIELDVWAAEVDDSVPTLMEWEDYIVLDMDLIPARNLELLGDLQDVCRGIR